MINFSINRELCTSCGLCAKNCVARIIEMENDIPVIPADKQDSCYNCQHCLTICPTGAVSILGLNAVDSDPLTGNYPDPDQMETLIKGRRSIRSYKPENLEPKIMQKLLEVAWHAPTGKNCREVLFTVVDDREKMSSLRDEIMNGLSSLIKSGTLPGNMSFFVDLVKLWEEERIDAIFRDAPHLLIASAPASCATPTQDCLIALSYFELLAQSMGVGTVWGGFAHYIFSSLLPELRNKLNIPKDHIIGYAMIFGKPAVHYARTAQHSPALIQRV